MARISPSDQSRSALVCLRCRRRLIPLKRLFVLPTARCIMPRVTARTALTHIREACNSFEPAMSHERIFGHISRDDFVGREAELRQLLSYASEPPRRKLLIAAAPNAGGSEFLRQAYDELFFRRTHAAPFHFEFAPQTGRLSEIAASFF